MDNSEELDEQLMARLADGHDGALNDLMSRHGEKLFHYLIRLVQNEADAADLAQETFVRVYRNRVRYRRGSKFSTWLYTIATNLVKDHYRWRGRHPAVSIEAENETTGASIGSTLAEARPDPGETMAASERIGAVRAAVGQLPEDLRTVLVLSEYEGRSNAEMGTILNCSVKAVESRLYRARQQLKSRLQQSPGFSGDIAPAAS